MASRKPFRKTPPRIASSTRVTATGWFSHAGISGFSMRWAVASAAERVMVMMKSVSAKPSRTSTKALPRQRGSSSSSMAMLPWPCGL